MKHRASSFEKLSTQLINLAIEISNEKDGKEAETSLNPIRQLRHKCIIMLAGITKSLEIIFRL